MPHSPQVPLMALTTAFSLVSPVKKEAHRLKASHSLGDTIPMNESHYGFNMLSKLSYAS